MSKFQFNRLVVGGAVLAVLCGTAPAQKKKGAGYDRAARATLLHDAIVYVAADPETQHISLVTPGHEVVVVERSGPWVKVFANTDAADDQDEDQKPDFGEDQNATPASGWIRDKGVVNPSTPEGDAILYGAAANFEEMASQPHAPKGAAAAAHLLYRRVAEYFPDSPLAPEASWRSADVRWQIDRLDIKSLPSAKEQDASLRPTIYEGELKRVIKKYPGVEVRGHGSFRDAGQQAVRRLAGSAQVPGDGDPISTRSTRSSIRTDRRRRRRSITPSIDRVCW